MDPDKYCSELKATDRLIVNLDLKIYFGYVCVFP